MASTPNNNALVILELKPPPPHLIQTNFTTTNNINNNKSQNEIFISTENISTWNHPFILSSQIIKIQTNKNKLIEQSSYFRTLLTGNFSESCLDTVSVEWNVETVVDMLRFIYGISLDVSVDNFIPLMEGAFFFGVDGLLLMCMSWFSKATSSRRLLTLQIPLESIIEIWSFGLQHAMDCLTELSAAYLARNFTWAISCRSFVEVPYNLLSCCLDHHHLTVHSEQDLADALLRWLEVNPRSLEGSSGVSKDDCSDILKTVRLSLLPFWFVAGKKGSFYFSELANESIGAILNLISDPSMSLLHLFRYGDLESIRIRLTDYTERIDLSGCPQITSALLFLSMLPCLHKMDPASKERIKEYMTEIWSRDLGKFAVPHKSFPTLSFDAVREVDISKCPQVHIEAAIKCFCKSFPSLKTLKASHCLHFKMKALFQLIQNCLLVKEVYLSADISPLIPGRVSTISSSIDGHIDLDVASHEVLKGIPLSSNITKLVLEGRTEINDFDLINISSISGSLCYLNLKGCTSITDIGISKLISKCLNLDSIVASDTYFGKNSTLALCSRFPSLKSSLTVENDQLTTLASRLQKLHIGGCKSVDETSLSQLMSHTCMLKSLCLRGTSLDDDATYRFLGSSLEFIDVSETMVCGATLAHIVRRNPGLKVIKSRGCRNLCYDEDNLGRSALSYGCSSGEQLYVEIGRSCNLEDVEFGWGFSSLSLENSGHAVRSLKSLTVGLGASLSQQAFMLLPILCPSLESVVLKFQVISDSIVRSIVESLRQLRVLSLCYCIGDLSASSFHLSMPNLRKLRLERVIPWMKNEDLAILVRNCTSLIELSLSGCTRLNSDSQQIISCGWPGLISLHLEDCGEVTSNGVSSLFDCKAIEDLSLRHSGSGIQKNFIVDAAAKLPMLRKVALDLCDASGGGFESPSYADRFFLSTVTIARCKVQKCAFVLQASEACRQSVHKESIVLEWNSKGFRTTVVKERV